MILTNERLIILDINLDELKNFGQTVSEFDPRTYSWSLMTLSHSDCQGFIIASAICEVPKRTEYTSEFLSPWVHLEGSATWIMKVKLNRKGKLEKQKTSENSVLIWYEWPECILEYSPNKMIVSLNPNSFLFLQDWLPVRHLEQK